MRHVNWDEIEEGQVLYLTEHRRWDRHYCEVLDKAEGEVFVRILKDTQAQEYLLDDPDDPESFYDTWVLPDWLRAPERADLPAHMRWPRRKGLKHMRLP